MLKKFGRLAALLLVAACGNIAPEMPLNGQTKNRSEGRHTPVPLQGASVERRELDAKTDESAFADAPQQTGGGFFVKRLVCRYTGVGLIFRPFGCKALDDSDAMRPLPRTLEAKFSLLDLLNLEIEGSIAPDASGTWHWIGEVPNLSALGASVRASLKYEDMSFDMEAPILEMGLPTP